MLQGIRGAGLAQVPGGHRGGPEAEAGQPRLLQEPQRADAPQDDGDWAGSQQHSTIHIKQVLCGAISAQRANWTDGLTKQCVEVASRLKIGIRYILRHFDPELCNVVTLLMFPPTNMSYGLQ